MRSSASWASVCGLMRRCRSGIVSEEPGRAPGTVTARFGATADPLADGCPLGREGLLSMAQYHTVGGLAALRLFQASHSADIATIIRVTMVTANADCGMDSVRLMGPTSEP